MLRKLLIIISFHSIGFNDCVLLDTQKIWSNENYSAFTALVYDGNFYYCAFRESSAHRAYPQDSTTWGSITLLRSEDLNQWDVMLRVLEDSADLRDPKLAFMKNGNLQLLYCCRKVLTNKLASPKTHSIRLDKEANVISRECVSINGYGKERQWIWGITYYKKEEAYGFMYGDDFLLLKSLDGVNYDIVSHFDFKDGMPTEGTLAFQNDTAYAVARGKNDEGLLGVSIFPFKRWNWYSLGMKVGGPSLISLPDGSLLLGTRNYKDEIGKTSLFLIQGREAKKILTLPSLRDSSYPSFVLIGDTLSVSYYSGKNGKADIYLSRLKLNLK